MLLGIVERLQPTANEDKFNSAGKDEGGEETEEVRFGETLKMLLSGDGFGEYGLHLKAQLSDRLAR